MSQYGACCNPSSNFPDPNNRDHPRGTAIPNNRRSHRRPTYFSPRLHRVSSVIANPTIISFREAVIAVVLLFALYRGFFTSQQAYNLLARQDVSRVCIGRTAMQCLRLHLWRCLWMGWDWGTQVLPWGLCAAVVVFFGEEIMRSSKKKLKG